MVAVSIEPPFVLPASCQDTAWVKSPRTCPAAWLARTPSVPGEYVSGAKEPTSPVLAESVLAKTPAPSPVVGMVETPPKAPDRPTKGDVTLVTAPPSEPPMPSEPELKTPEAPRPTLATLPSPAEVKATPAKTTPPMTSKKRTPKAPNAPDPVNANEVDPPMDPMDADPPIEDSEIEACPREGRQATSAKAIIKRVPFLWNSL